MLHPYVTEPKFKPVLKQLNFIYIVTESTPILTLINLNSCKKNINLGNTYKYKKWNKTKTESINAKALPQQLTIQDISNNTTSKSYFKYLIVDTLQMYFKLK